MFEFFKKYPTITNIAIFISTLIAGANAIQLIGGTILGALATLGVTVALGPIVVAVIVGGGGLLLASAVVRNNIKNASLREAQIDQLQDHIKELQQKKDNLLKHLNTDKDECERLAAQAASLDRKLAELERLNNVLPILIKDQQANVNALDYYDNQQKTEASTTYLSKLYQNLKPHLDGFLNRYKNDFAEGPSVATKIAKVLKDFGLADKSDYDLTVKSTEKNYFVDKPLPTRTSSIELAKRKAKAIKGKAFKYSLFSFVTALVVIKLSALAAGAAFTAIALGPIGLGLVAAGAIAFGTSAAWMQADWNKKKNAAVDQALQKKEQLKQDIMNISERQDSLLSKKEDLTREIEARQESINRENTRLTKKIEKLSDGLKLRLGYGVENTDKHRLSHLPMQPQPEFPINPEQENTTYVDAVARRLGDEDKAELLKALKGDGPKPSLHP